MDDKRDQYNEEESGRFGRRFTPNPMGGIPRANGSNLPRANAAQGSMPSYPDRPYAPQPQQQYAQPPYQPQPQNLTPVMPVMQVTPIQQVTPTAFGQQFVTTGYPQASYPNPPTAYAPQRPVNEEFEFDPDTQGTASLQDVQHKKKGIFGWKNRRDDDAINNIRNVIISYPKTYTDVQMIIDSLRNRQAIIVDLTRINDKSTQRILDFLSGAIYALCGSQQRIGDNMFLFTPDGVSIQGPTDLKRRYDHR